MLLKKEIVDSCLKHNLSLKQCAYVLATAWHETNETMEPVREAYWLSEDWRKNNLRYYPWYGRGYVQLTWERNYRFAGEQLGMDLATDPDVVMEPKVSTEILVLGMKEGWFTGKKLSDYINDHRTDYLSARKTVNGMDRSELIASYAERYEESLKSSGVYKKGFIQCLKDKIGTLIRG